jgi:hypothetical protein
MFAVVKKPGRVAAKTANNTAKTANTIPCCPRLLIPIPTSLLRFVAADVGALWEPMQAITGGLARRSALVNMLDGLANIPRRETRKFTDA